MRSVWSVKNELIKKSREAMLAAVQVYNNPQITFKSETFITLVVISWTYLLHAYYKKAGIDYRYFKGNGNRKTYDKTKHGAIKLWELERCINEDKCPIDTETKLNLLFLIGLRHEIEHQMTNRIDDYLSAKFQACCINYARYLMELFGEKYDIKGKLALSLQFSPITLEQKDELIDSKRLSSNVKNYITSFEANLTDEQASNTRYAYRLFFVPKSVNKKGQADRVIEFIKADSPLAEGLNKEFALIKETEKDKYLPKTIVQMMNDEGYSEFTMSVHTNLWKGCDAKNPSKHYGVYVAEKQWYWYSKWLDYVRAYCKKEYAEK